MGDVAYDAADYFLSYEYWGGGGIMTLGISPSLYLFLPFNMLIFFHAPVNGKNGEVLVTTVMIYPLLSLSQLWPLPFNVVIRFLYVSFNRLHVSGKNHTAYHSLQLDLSASCESVIILFHDLHTSDAIRLGSFFVISDQSLDYSIVLALSFYFQHLNLLFLP